MPQFDPTTSAGTVHAGKVQLPSVPEPELPSPAPASTLTFKRMIGTDCLQNYTHIDKYFTADHWSKGCTQAPTSLHDLTTHCLHLDLRHPSESSSQKVVACYLLMTGGGADLTPDQKNILLNEFKDMLRQHNRREVRGMIRLTALPEDPSIVREQAPEIWRRAFGRQLHEQAPIPSPFTEVEMTSICRSIPLRWGARRWQAAAASRPQQHSGSMDGLRVAVDMVRMLMQQPEPIKVRANAVSRAGCKRGTEEPGLQNRNRVIP